MKSSWYKKASALITTLTIYKYLGDASEDDVHKYIVAAYSPNQVYKGYGPGEINVQAYYDKGSKGGLSEPPYPAGWDIEGITDSETGEDITNQFDLNDNKLQEMLTSDAKGKYL